MTSIGRSRQRTFSAPAGGSSTISYTRYIGGAPYSYVGPSTSTWTNPDGDRDTCDDAITTSLPYEDHPLTLDHRRMKVGRLSGSGDTPTPVNGKKYHYSYSGWSHQAVSYASLQYATQPPVDWIGLRNAFLAATNINKPAVDVPLFLFELREFPRMVRDLGRYLKREISNQDVPGVFLSYSYGWGPLDRDLNSLLGIYDAIGSRVRFLRDIRGKKSIKRTLSKGKLIGYQDLGSSEIFSLGATGYEHKVIVHRSVDYSWKSWGVGKIVVDNPSQLDSLISDYDAGLTTRTRQRLYGLTGPRLATVWNAIPWSFLIDYFGKVSDALEAGRGYIPYHVKTLNLMHRQLLENRSVEVFNNSSLSFHPGNIQFERLNRSVVQNPQIRLPTFDTLLSRSTQLKLGALALAAILRS